MAAQMSQKLEEGLSIGSLIRKVHEELAYSQRQRQIEGVSPLFEVDSLTIEAHFTVTSSDEEKGGIDLKIVNLGATAGIKSEQVHKIILALKTVTNRDQLIGLTEPEMAPDGLRPRLTDKI